MSPTLILHFSLIYKENNFEVVDVDFFREFIMASGWSNIPFSGEHILYVLMSLITSC